MNHVLIHGDDRRKYPELPLFVPIEMLNEEQAMENHKQSLSRLNERGGLGVLEMLDNIHKRKLTWRKENQKDVDELMSLIRGWQKQNPVSRDERMEKIHRTWWDFSKFLKDAYGELSELAGEHVIDGIERYADKHPEIKVVPCDDTHHSSSILVLVPHPTMGITIIFVPQLTTENNQFFLYPNHLRALMHELTEMAPVVAWDRFKENE